MKIVIIEDEELAASRLERMILQYDPNINIMAKLESVEESIDWFNNNEDPDLIFLDIHLEDGLSFAIFENVNISSSIIFTTAFDEYAIKAFKLKSIDYLLKPIVQEELNNSIMKYKDLTGINSKPQVDISSLLQLLNNNQNTQTEYKNRFAVQVGTKMKSFGIDEISYFFSENGITFLATNGKSLYSIDSSLDKLMSQLDPKEFFRVNRAFLVKHSSIQNIHVFPKSKIKLDLIPATAKEVYVSQDKISQFKTWLDT